MAHGALARFVSATCALLLVTMGCAGARREVTAEDAAIGVTETGGAKLPAGETVLGSGPHPRNPVAATPPEAALWAPTTTAPARLQPAAGGCTPPPTEHSAPPAHVRDAIAPHLGDARWSGNTPSVSVWVEGWGEIATLNPDTPLAPASNQKLLVAAGVLAGIEPSARLRTLLVTTGPIVGGVVQGDLVLVAGGDPTLLQSGLNSLDTLVAQLRARGVTKIAGRLLVDESRYDDARTAPGWPESQWPLSVGPLSALVIGRNNYGSDAGFLRDPSLTGAEVLRSVLRAQEIEVLGSSGYGSGAAGTVVAATDSPPIGELVTTMLHRSDNLTAELLVKELAHRYTGRPGSTAEGLEVVRRLLSDRCAPTDGTDVDGSGLSRDNARSARAWRRLLQAVMGQPWWPTFYASLPVAGQNGTLGNRLVDPSTAGNVRAKTGMTIPARSMSGYLTTAGGRRAVFSVIVNGPNLGRAEEAIDALVTTVAKLPG